MKKLIIIFLLITGTAYSQWLPFDWYNKKVSTAVTYNVRASNFFTRVEALGQTLTADQKKVYDTIFVRLNDSGLIGTVRLADSVAALWSFALKIAKNETIAKLNLLDTGYNCTNVNSVVFTDSGAVGNGTSSYLNTKFNNKNDSTIAKLNSVTYGFVSHIPQNMSGTRCPIGNATASSVLAILYDASGTFYYYNNDLSPFTVSYSDARAGVFSSVRVSYNKSALYKNGSGNAFVTQNSVSINNLNTYILCANNDGTPQYYSSQRLSFAFIGSGLSADKQRKLSNILNEALRQFNYNVY